jgi:uncharacterized protein (DUF433 family)
MRDPHESMRTQFEKGDCLRGKNLAGSLQRSQHMWPRSYQGMGWPDRIVIDSEILAGKPVIRGTRLAVEFILDLLAEGQPEADILANYPGLTHDDILACSQVTTT